MLTVADVMTRRPIIVGPQMTVGTALDAMQKRGISSLLVGPLPGPARYGIVTMRDIVSKIVQHDLKPEAVVVGDIMTPRLITADPMWSLRRAAETMTTATVRRLPVVVGSELAGIVSDTDLFTSLIPESEWKHARVVRKERAWRRAGQAGPAKIVRDLMSAPVLSVAPNAMVIEAVRKMTSSGVTSLLVEAAGGSAEGIVTKRDVIANVVARGEAPRRVRVGDIMSAPVRTIEPEATVEACSARMVAERMRRFPVHSEGGMIGIISDSDILAAVAARRWQGRREHRWPTAFIVADVMRPWEGGAAAEGADAVSPELSVWECAARLSRRGLNTQFPVVQEGRVIGIVGEADILAALEERGGVG